MRAHRVAAGVGPGADDRGEQRVLGWEGAGAGALLGLALGALPAAILSGAIVHEGVPVALAAVHALDWVVKLTVIGALVGLLA